MIDEVRVSVFMAPELRNKLALLAKVDRRSLARYIEVLLAEHVKAKESGA